MLKLKDNYEFKTTFTEIGYFGQYGSEALQEAKEFVENSDEGWRIPNEDEAEQLATWYYEILKDMISFGDIFEEKYFYILSDYRLDPQVLARGCYDADAPIEEILNFDYTYIFLVR